MLVRRSTLTVECEQWILLFSINVHLLSTALLSDFTTVESVTLQAGPAQSGSQVPDSDNETVADFVACVLEALEEGGRLLLDWTRCLLRIE